MSDTSENGLSGQALGFMRQAIELSEENVRSGGGPFGAVIVRDGRVIATGTNGVTLVERPHGACRGDGDPQCGPCVGDVRPERL